MRAALFLPVVALSFATACATRPPVMSSRAIPDGAISVPMRRDESTVSIFQGNSGMTDSARLVMRGDAEWRRTWAQLIGHITPAPEPPAIDFTKEMVIIAAMGPRPTAGYMIRIARVGRSSGVTYVDVVSESPGLKCSKAQTMTSPADVVVVPKIDEPVAFVETLNFKVC
jgi:protease stability complex PrcB-like protein